MTVGTTKKRISAAICALLLAASMGIAIPACSSMGADDTIELLIKVPRIGHDTIIDGSIDQIDQVISVMVDSFEQEHPDRNIDISVKVFEQNQYEASIEDTLDTEYAPDILYGDFYNISKYIHTGKVVPLNDIVTGYVENDLLERLMELGTIDGRIYMLPYLARQNILAYNKELFREAGLEQYIEDGVIQSWTLDEWTHILDTLAANLPDDVYPMMMYAGDPQGDTHTMTLLRAAGSSFFDESGHFDLSTPEGIAALQWIQDGVDAGWYPPHCENLVVSDCNSLFRNGQLAISTVNNANIVEYGNSIGLVNFPGPGPEGCVTAFVAGFEVFDNGNEEKVDLAKEFLSYVYNNEKLMSYAAGTLPASKAVSEHYGDKILDYELFDANRANLVSFTGDNTDMREIRDVFYLELHDLLLGDITAEEAAANLDARCNAIIDENAATSVLHE